jgi:hypothetical protein
LACGGPVSSISQVPLAAVLPQRYLGVEASLRRLANDLDSRRPTADRGGWHWYPERAREQRPSDDRIHYPLVETAIKLHDTGVDWLELPLYIAWGSPPGLPDAPS